MLKEKFIYSYVVLMQIGQNPNLLKKIFLKQILKIIGYLSIRAPCNLTTFPIIKKPECALSCSIGGLGGRVVIIVDLTYITNTEVLRSNLAQGRCTRLPDGADALDSRTGQVHSTP